MSSYGQCYNVVTRVGLSCRMGQRGLPRRGRQWANYGFESWRMRGVSSLGTTRTTPYCYHKQPASALGFCGIGNAPMRPQQNSHWRAKYQAQLARLKPLITILSVWAISCAHRLARSRASGGAVRDAKKATKYLSNNSLLPDKSIKKRRLLH